MQKTLVLLMLAIDSPQIIKCGAGGGRSKSGSSKGGKSAGGGALSVAQKTAMGEFQQPTDTTKPKFSLPDGVRAEDITTPLLSGSGVLKDRNYYFKTGDLRVEVSFSETPGSNSVSIDFTVNGRFGLGSKISDRDANLIALKVAKITKYDATTRPDGFKYDASAFNSDGYGARRSLGYNKQGFTIPDSGRPGAKQYGVVKNGRIVPDTKTWADRNSSNLDAAKSTWSNAIADSKNSRGARKN